MRVLPKPSSGEPFAVVSITVCATVVRRSLLCGVSRRSVIVAHSGEAISTTVAIDEGDREQPQGGQPAVAGQRSRGEHGEHEQGRATARG